MTVLLVATSGGHLEELFRLRPRLTGLDLSRVRWVTYDTPQTRSLLKDEEVSFIGEARTKELGAVLRNIPAAIRILRAERIDAIVTTGAQITLSFAPVASALGIPMHFIESAARRTGRSRSGKLTSMLPRVVHYTQYPSQASERVLYRGSVLDGFVATPCAAPPVVRRAVVALGTGPFGFRPLLELALRILPPDAEVLWQTGVTDVGGLPISARPYLPSAELASAIREADVVLAHAGIGTILASLAQHKCPVIVPRSPARDELEDDHQRVTADEVARRGLAVNRPLERLATEDLYLAAGWRVDLKTAPAPIDLLAVPRRTPRPRSAFVRNRR